MNRRKLVTIVWSTITLGCLASGLLASIAWFASANKFDVDITGSVVDAYFHDGTGTENDPFIITRPIHYYHLVEFFQRVTKLDEDAEFGKDYLYFQIGTDLDNDGYADVYEYDNQGIDTGELSKTLNMAYYSGENALLPIGTNEVPFIGVFDGKANEGITVSNLNIHCSETVIINDDEVVREASDIGIFGYVADQDTGSHPTIIQNLKVEGLTIDLSDVTDTVASSDTTTVHTSTHAGIAYVGYVAGHVHTYTNYSSTGPTDATPLHDVYVTDATIQGGAGATCGFGYIGLVDTVDGQVPETIQYDVSTAHGEGQGQGNEWGGSIDMLSLNRRIRYYLNKNLTSLTGGSSSNPASIVKNKAIKTKARRSSYQYRYRYYTDDNASYSTFQGGSGETYYDKDPGTNAIIYRLVGGGSSVLGLDNTSGSYNDTAYFEIPESYIPLLSDTEENNYATLEDNTGYIVGDLLAGQNTVRTASYSNSYIQNSYVSSELEVLSNSTASYNASNYKRINNGNTHTSSALSNYSATIQPNSLSGFSSAYTKMCGVLSSSTYVQGLHFAGNVINDSNISTVPSAWIDGTNYTDYKVLRSSVDFNAKKNGSIKFFAGSYYNNVGTNADSFFSLHTVTRSGNTVTPTQIYYIYANTNATTKKDYPHLYYDDSNNLIAAGYGNNVTKGSLEFDMGWLHNAPPVANAVYYFEIPVNAGEFALGSVAANKTQGAYLMYLDIGTSGSTETPTHNETFSISNISLFSQLDFQISATVTNTCFNVAFVVPDDATKSTFSVNIKGGSKTHEGHSWAYYEITIVNTTGHDCSISVLLTDNDNSPDNDFYYMYAIKYNGGALTDYFESNTYTGASGGTSMTPTYTQSQQQGD